MKTPCPIKVVAILFSLLGGYVYIFKGLIDKLGTRYLKLAGYDPYGMISFFIKLQQYERKQPLRQLSYYKTHPYVPERIRIVKEELGKGMNFDDYINIENQPHKPR